MMGNRIFIKFLSYKLMKKMNFRSDFLKILVKSYVSFEIFKIWVWWFRGLRFRNVEFWVYDVGVQGFRGQKCRILDLRCRCSGFYGFRCQKCRILGLGCRGLGVQRLEMSISRFRGSRVEIMIFKKDSDPKNDDFTF